MIQTSKRPNIGRFSRDPTGERFNQQPTTPPMLSIKSTITMLILAVISVIAAILITPSDGPAARRAAHEPGVLVTPDTFPIDQINRITLTRRNQATLTFERGDAGWMQTEPFAVHMDRYRMRRLKDAVRTVEVLDRVALDDDALPRSAVALDPSEAVIKFEWSGGSKRIELGRRGIGGRAYLRMADENEVLVISQHLHELAVDGDPRAWRDRAVFRDVGVDSDRVVRIAGQQRMVLERDRRQWIMVEPVRTRISDEIRDIFMQALGGARVKSFIADEPRQLDRFGLAPPQASITVVTTQRIPDPNQPDGEPIESTDVQRLLIGSPAGAGTQDRFGMIEGRPTVFRLPVDAMQHLFIQPEELIAPTASGVIPADVKSIVVRGPAGEFRLERDLEDWHAPDHAYRRVPADAVNRLLTQLTEARARSVAISEYPHELEVATVTFHGFHGRPIDTVRIIREPADGRWAMDNGDNVLRVFADDISLPLTPDAFGLSE